jgi:hypothetical protein
LLQIKVFWDVAWCCWVCSSRILRDCGAIFKHPGLFDCEDSSFKHGITRPTIQLSHASRLVSLYLACFITKLSSGCHSCTRVTDKRGLIQQRHGSFGGPPDTPFCNRKEIMTNTNLDFRLPPRC